MALKTLAVQVRDIKALLEGIQCAIDAQSTIKAGRQSEENRANRTARNIAPLSYIRSLARWVDELTDAFREYSCADSVDAVILDARTERATPEIDLEAVNEITDRHGGPVLRENDRDEIEEVLDDYEVSRYDLLTGEYSEPSEDYFYFDGDFYGVDDLEEFLEEKYPDDLEELREEALEKYTEEDLELSCIYYRVANNAVGCILELIEDYLPAMLGAERSSANEHTSPEEAEKAPESLADEFDEEEDN